jgi:hypothetical protein
MGSRTKKQGGRAGVERGGLVTAEGNFEELPFFLVAGGRTSGEGVIVVDWESEFVDRKGETRARTHRWEVRGSVGLGLPGRVEQDVYVALLDLLESRGGMPDDGKVYFTLRELLGFMGWDRDGGGGSYERVRQALKCITSTTIDSRRAFFSQRLNRYITDNFQMFSSHTLEAEDVEAGSVYEGHHVIFHPYYRDSYNESYAGRLDTSFYWTLAQHSSKRLYRLLDRRAAEDGGSRVWEADLLLLRDLMPLGHYKAPVDIKGALQKAHAELTQKGFLRSVTFREEAIRGERGGRPRKRVLARYRLSTRFAARSFSKAIDLTEDQRDAAEQLVGWGVERRIAEEKVLSLGADRCRYWAELLPYQDNVRAGEEWKLLLYALKDEPEWWEEIAERKRRRGAEKGGDAAKAEGGKKPKRGRRGGGSPAGGDRGEQERWKDYEWLLEAGERRGGTAGPRATEVRAARRAWSALRWRLALRGLDPGDGRMLEECVGVRLRDRELIVAAPSAEAAEELIEKYGHMGADAWRELAGDERARLLIGSEEECAQLLSLRDEPAGG